MPVFEYKCECGITQDRVILTRPRPAIVPCACGKQAVFQISAPHLSMKMGLDAIGSPTAARRWERAHSEKLKEEQRRQDG